MLEALLHGKLSIDQENMEDILTSCVFGTFRLLSPASGLVPFLQRVQFQEQDEVDNSVRLLLNVITGSVKYEFWPMLDFSDCHRCEPDLVLTFPEAGLIVLVEAKFRSGKSSLPDDHLLPIDQLAREWDNLVRLAAVRKCRPLMVYLTADPHYPRAEISESINEYCKKRSSMPRPEIGWLGWHQILELKDSNCGTIERLKAIIEKLDLTPFRGFPAIFPAPLFSFREAQRQFVWPSVIPVPRYEYES